MTASLDQAINRQSDIHGSILRLAHDESGQDMIEYALIAASLGLASVAGVNGLAAHICNYMSLVGAGFDNAVRGM